MSETPGGPKDNSSSSDSNESGRHESHRSLTRRIAAEQRGRIDRARVNVALLRAKFVDSMMGVLIAVGGVSTIIALLLVVMVLLVTVVPLLRPAQVADWNQFPVPSYSHMSFSSDLSHLWGVQEDGKIALWSLGSAKRIASQQISHEGHSTTCSYLFPEGNCLAYGYDDGDVQLVNVEFDENQFTRSQSTNTQKPSKQSSGKLTALQPVTHRVSDWPVRAFDYVPTVSTGPFVELEPSSLIAVCGRDAQHAELVLATIRRPFPVIGDSSNDEVDVIRMPIRGRSQDATPLMVMAMAGLRHVLVLWPDGSLDRYSVHNDGLEWRESCSLVVGSERLTAVSRMFGRQTLLCGTNQGRVLSCTIANSESESSPTETNVTASSDSTILASRANLAETNLALPATEQAIMRDDGFRIRISHQLQVSEEPIQCLASGGDSHHFLVSDERGIIRLYHATTDNLLATTRFNDGHEDVGRVERLWFGAGDDQIFAKTTTHVLQASVDKGNSDASWKAFFEPVWYEGHDEPKFIWQPAYGSETSQAKLSLMPLFFGTLKATMVSLFFAVPLAILAAIYSSEFLSNRLRMFIKPVIELMASVPGVVLGYIVAIVVAPVLREHILVLLVLVACLPILYLFFGRLWAIAESKQPHSRRPVAELLALLLSLPLSVFIACGLARFLELLWFSGNFVDWVSTRDGSSWGGWILLFFPLVTLLSVYIVVPRANQLCNRVPAGARRHAARAISILVVSLLSLLVACFLGLIFASAGWDLRQTLFTSFQERNAVVVGFALTFCCVPLIFTMAEDALRAVPKEQRSASIACGASTWQTVTRIVLPSAISGLISAVIVGAGRVIGETMIVLMVVGNTPLMEWNPFSGLRALTATLATELPEASKGSTHYRTLFLAALMLFVFTLAANTLAEYVRLRGRKRVSQL